MYKLYIKQAWAILKENRIISSLSIAGTALSIAAIMLVVLVYQVIYADYAPENHRFRTLYVDAFQAGSKIDQGSNRGQMGVRVLRECLYDLKIPEAVTGISMMQMPVNLPGQKIVDKYPVKYTDTAFWKVFDFDFISGAPFTASDFDSGIHRAVMSESAARKVFGAADVVGRTFRINFEDYTVCGVVKDVSMAASSAYAKIWMPYTVNKALMEANVGYYEATTGAFTACILARSSADFSAIRNEAQRALARFNTTLKNTKTNFLAGPITQMDKLMGGNGFYPVKTAEFIASRGVLILFLLVLPALNIVGITLTQFRKRRSEIGVRKAFGAPFRVIVEQVLVENMLCSLIGGVIGLFLSYGLLSLCKNLLISNDVELTAGMLLKPGTFLLAFLFTLLMNLISVGIPAIRSARMPIVTSLNDVD